jgi:hypothetical protein
MTDPTITLSQTRIAGGVWEGVLAGVAGPVPEVAALHQGVALADVQVLPMPGKPGLHAVRVTIPATILSEGVQTVLLTVAGDVLGQFTIVAGEPLEADLRAELSLLRAELDLLKRSFQRQFRAKD